MARRCMHALLILCPIFLFAQSPDNSRPVRDTVVLEGFISADRTLSSGKVYLVKHNVKIAKNAVLTIPGNTTFLLEFNTSIVAEGGIRFNGSPGSWIEVTSRNPKSPGNGLIITGTEGKEVVLQYTRFNGVNTPLTFEAGWFRPSVNIQNCVFTNILTGEPVIYIANPASSPDVVKGRTIQFNFSQNTYSGNWGSLVIENLQSDVLDLKITDNLFTNNVVYAVRQGDPSNALIYGIYDDLKSKYVVTFSGNAIFGNYQINSVADTIIREIGLGIQGSGEVFNIPNNFFRSTDPGYISSTFDHFYQNSSLPLLQVEPVAPAPSENVPPHIWKVRINNRDITNYGNIPEVGQRDVTFEVSFNKPVEPFGEYQVESIVYDTANNELLVTPVAISEGQWSPDRKKFTFKVSNASFLGNTLGYMVISNFRDRSGQEVPPFTLGQVRAVNNYKRMVKGGIKSAELISRPGQEGLDVDIERGAFLKSLESVKTLRALTDLGDLSYLGPFESLVKSWELGIQLGTSAYTGSLTDRFASRDHWHLAGGIYGQYNFHKWASVRAMLWIGQISGNDIKSSSLADRARLANFRNLIVEGSLTLHWHLLKYGTSRGERFVPTIFGGIALYRNNPEARIFMTLDEKGYPRYLRWKDGQIVTDWRNNTDGYDQGKDLWVRLRDIGTEGQTAKTPDAEFPDRNPPKKYSKVQIGFPVGMEINWIIRQQWNIGAHFGVTLTTTRYLDDLGGFYYDRATGHQAIIDANPSIKAKAGNKKVTIQGDDLWVTFEDDHNLIETYHIAALAANPSLVRVNELESPDSPLSPYDTYGNYAYHRGDLPNPEGSRSDKNLDNYDLYFFGGVKVSYIFKRKKDRESKAKSLEKTVGADAYTRDTDNDGIPDNEEKQMGTNPQKADTDGDGLPDKREIELGTNPKVKDTDRDGIVDGKDRCPTIAGVKSNQGCPE